MAHFFDTVTTAPLITCEISPGEIKKVGLWGGDFFGNDLGVLIDQSVVRIQEKNRQSYVRYFELTGIKIGQATLHAFAGLYDFAFPIEVSVKKKMAIPQGKLTERRNIVNVAIKQSDEGAHYLWGTNGNTPDKSDGQPGKALVAKMHADSFAVTNASDYRHQTSVSAAYATQDQYCTCAGLSESAKFARISQMETTAYLKAGKSVPLNGLTPRVYVFRNVIKSPLKHNDNSIVWGEPCTNKRHFDCIGLVNWSLNQFVKGGCLRRIDQWMENPGNAGCIEIFDKTDLMDADIVGMRNWVTPIGKDGKPILDAPQVASWHHIGMIYMVGNKAMVVQAEDSPTGVTKGTAYDPQKWSRRIRLMDNQF